MRSLSTNSRAEHKTQRASASKVKFLNPDSVHSLIEIQSDSINYLESRLSTLSASEKTRLGALKKEVAQLQKILLKGSNLQKN